MSTRALLGVGWGCRCQYARPSSCGQGTHRVVVGHVLDLLIVISPSQLGQTLWVQSPAVWKELGTVLLGELCAEGVDGDDEGSSVSFKLWGQYTGKARGRGKEAAASQLAGLPPGPGYQGLVGRKVGKHSPPGWDTWHRLWSRPVGCRTCRRTPGRPAQSMGLAQLRQGAGGFAKPSHSCLFPSPVPCMVSPYITPINWPGQPPCQNLGNICKFPLLISWPAASLHPGAIEQFLTY